MFSAVFTGNGLQIFAPVFVSDVYGYSFSIAGVDVRREATANFYFAVMLISGAVSTLIAVWLADSFDHRTVFVSLLGVTAVGLFVLSSLPLTPLFLLLVFVIVGSCLFAVNPVRDAIITDITP